MALGSFGTTAPPRVARFVAYDPVGRDLTYGAGDRFEIEFDMATTRARDEGGRAYLDTLFAFTSMEQALTLTLTLAFHRNHKRNPKPNPDPKPKPNPNPSPNPSPNPNPNPNQGYRNPALPTRLGVGVRFGVTLVVAVKG